MEHLEKIVKKVPKAAYKLAEAFWPGPMTMILEKNDLVPYGTTGGLDTVAIRMPSDPIALELIRQGGGYIAAPSANTSGRPSPTTAQHVYEDLQGKIPMILDGGAVTIGLESTIVDLTEEIPTILRPGFISLDMVQAVLGEAQIDRGLIANDSNIHPKAPGMKYRHYAPGVPVAIVDPQTNWQSVNAWIAKQPSKVGVMAEKQILDAFSWPDNAVIYSLGEDVSDASSHLFAGLRFFDDQKDVASILVQGLDATGLGAAYMNRLNKSAGGRHFEAPVK